MIARPLPRAAQAAAAVLCSLALLAPTAAAQSSDFAETSSKAANDAWRQGYNAMPQQLRDAIPRELRPAEPAQPSPAPAPPVEPKTDTPAEPTPAPDTCANCVALTFDDGPGPDTPRLLDILDKKGAKATFFVVGPNAKANPAVMKRILDSGHTVANHTYNHPQMNKLSDAGIAKELDDTNAVLQKTPGVTPKWMRPPYGAYDQRVTAAAGKRGMAVAMWDVDTADWQHRNSARTCAIAVQNATPGSIILMHDIHTPTVDAVPCVIDGLQAKGYRLVGLEQMIKQPEAGKVYTHKP